MGDYWMRVKNNALTRSQKRQVEPDKLGGVCGGFEHRIFQGMAKAFEGS